MKSTFWNDGYRAAWSERTPCPPDVNVYRLEYLDGYQKCLDDMKATDQEATK